MSTQISTNPFLICKISSSFLPYILQGFIELIAVDLRASSGHGKNQSIVVQLTNPGKVLILRLKLSPTGLIQRTKCKFSLH